MRAMKFNMKKKNGTAGTVLFMIVVVAAITAAFMFITRGKESEKLEADVARTEVETLTEKNLAVAYPQTPREVVKLYGRITKCLYNTELTDDEMKDLIGQLRYLYSDELLENNTEISMIAFTSSEKESFTAEKKEIFGYTVDSASKIRYLNDKGGERAVINMYFTTKTGSRFDRSYEEFVLRKDSEGRWKILGWRETEETDVSED